MNTPLGFRIIDNAVSNCDQFIDWLELQEWKRSEVINGDSETRTSSTAMIPFISYRLPNFITNINKSVWDNMNQYAIDWKFPFLDIEDVSIQRYEADNNQHYDVHIDHGPQTPRVMSAILYLNTCNGGETYFPHFDFSIYPIEGRIAIFPSNFIYAHEAKPPKSGIKYAAAYWAFGG